MSPGLQPAVGVLLEAHGPGALGADIARRGGRGAGVGLGGLGRGAPLAADHRHQPLEHRLVVAVELRELGVEVPPGLGLQLAEQSAQAVVVVAVEIDLVAAGRDDLGHQRLEAAAHVLADGEDHVPAGRTLLGHRRHHLASSSAPQGGAPACKYIGSTGRAQGGFATGGAAGGSGRRAARRPGRAVRRRSARSLLGPRPIGPGPVSLGGCALLEALARHPEEEQAKDKVTRAIDREKRGGERRFGKKRRQRAPVLDNPLGPGHGVNHLFDEENQHKIGHEVVGPSVAIRTTTNRR